MKHKTLLQKIKELNKYCGGSLGLQHFSNGWEISSFKDGSLFGVGGKIYLDNVGRHMSDKSLIALINKALAEMAKDRLREYRKDEENRHTN